jgi:hypothetical protein
MKNGTRQGEDMRYSNETVTEYADRLIVEQANEVVGERRGHQQASPLVRGLLVVAAVVAVLVCLALLLSPDMDYSRVGYTRLGN